MVDDARVDINYIKSAAFREVACDGVVGGPTPNGKIWISFYTERFPLPRISRHTVTKNEDGSYVVEMPGIEEGRKGIVRNIEFGVYMSQDEARTLANWLTESLDELSGEGKTDHE